MQQLLQLSVASPSDILLQLVQQRHSLSSAMSATERNIQQLVELCRSRFGSFSALQRRQVCLMPCQRLKVHPAAAAALSPPHEMRQLQVRSVKI
jgi:hypothetical protein